MREAGAITASGAYCRWAKELVRRIRRHAGSWRCNGVRRLLSLREGIDEADSTACGKLAP